MIFSFVVCCNLEMVSGDTLAGTHLSETRVKSDDDDAFYCEQTKYTRETRLLHLLLSAETLLEIYRK